ncbi:MAG: glycosyl hydrolase-related protein [Tannerellaceae bacterium]|jgi:alpha-mannosidase|nr:glycosyl hydrolase-related protein [Tannerellaceae bacterium]
MKRILFSLLMFICLTVSMNGQKKEYKAYLVSTAHFDTQWNWDVKESIDDYLRRTMVQNFWLFERFPDYVFNFEAAQKYSWMKEYYPAEYALLKEYIKKGRWNITGSTWEATDPNLPAAESFFRNILYGQEFYKKEFGLKTNDIYLPDCFGFGYTLPTIAAHSGLIGFSTQKLQWRKNPYFGEKEKMPFKIGLWQGIDGSRIMAVLDAGGYGTTYYYDDVSSNKRIIDRAEAGPNKTAYAYYGVGDRGGSPTLPSVYSVSKSLQADGPLEIISARASQIYEDYLPFDKHPELDVYEGELLMDVHGVGCYTSQAAMKLFNRRNEQLADAAERASVAAELLGGASYPAEELRENWQRFLWHQFHDDITGTSIPRAYTFSWNDELIAQTRFADAITTAVGAVSRALNTQLKGVPVVVYNPVAYSRRDWVRATIEMPKRPERVSVTAPNGRTHPAQLLSWENGQATVLFPAEVEPVSFSVYEIKAGGSSASSTLKVSAQTIENAVYKLTLDKNGDIGSLLDKRSGRQLVKEGKAFRLMLLTDNVSTSYPAWEIYKKTIDGPSVSITDNVNISIAESGPLRAALKVERSYQDSTRFVQYICLTDGAADDRIDIINEYDWAARNVLLKAEFATTLSNEKASYDLGLGHVQRGNNVENSFEVLGHQWADLTDADGSHGLAILNDSKYGWDKPDNHSLRLTLLHTPQTDRGFRYQAHQDHGHHTFRYALVSHASTAVESQIAWKADAFNQPLLSFLVPKHPGPLGRSFALAKTSQAQIAIKAIKKAEDGLSYVIRLHEISGEDYADASLEFASPIESAVECNGIEEAIGEARFSGKRLTFSGKAFQPRTFSVKLKAQALLDVPDNQFVDLTYNAVAFTSEAFNKAGNFDRQGNSLPSELIPSLITSDGIQFKVNNDPSVFDYVRSKGDTIYLPQGHGANKLYLLLTSSGGDRATSFRVDDQTYAVNIPYYSGFFGQWGWTGESEGYIKEGSFAFIANHRHSERKGNDSYTFACLYKVCLHIDKNAKMLILPQDSGVALFAATLTNNENHDTKAATEMRSLPHKTQAITYETKPLPPGRERSAW